MGELHPKEPGAGCKENSAVRHATVLPGNVCHTKPAIPVVKNRQMGDVPRKTEYPAP